VELFEAIRRDHRGEGLSIRELAGRHRVHRRTVRQALASAVPPPRKARVFPAPALDPVKPLIDAMLRQDLDAPEKQRHTARRILARLVDEHGVTAFPRPRCGVGDCRVLRVVGPCATPRLGVSHVMFSSRTVALRAICFLPGGGRGGRVSCVPGAAAVGGPVLDGAGCGLAGG
jgi:hypothetical protein